MNQVDVSGFGVLHLLCQLYVSLGIQEKFLYFQTSEMLEKFLNLQKILVSF